MVGLSRLLSGEEEEQAVVAEGSFNDAPPLSANDEPTPSLPRPLSATEYLY